MRLRIVNMAEVDVGLFDFDFDTTFALFVINSKRNVYLRYGARTDESPDAMLYRSQPDQSTQRGLATHAKWKSGGTKTARTGRTTPRTVVPNVKNVVKKNQCVHCHQVGEGRALKLIALENFDKKTMPWVYPDPATLGLEIDPDDGVRLKKTSGSASTAGVKSGESIQKIGVHMVNTFADIQHALHHLPVESKQVEITTERASVLVPLPPFWRVTDINRRSIGHRMTPFPEFWGKTLSHEEKRELGLDPEGFATRVTKFWTNTNGKKSGLRMGDIVFDINGETRSPLAKNAMIYIRTHFETGDEIEMQYLREKKKQRAQFNLRAKPW